MKVEVEITGNGVEAVVFVDGEMKTTQMKNCEVKSTVKTGETGEVKAPEVKTEDNKLAEIKRYLEACKNNLYTEAIESSTKVQDTIVEEGLLMACARGHDKIAIYLLGHSAHCREPQVVSKALQVTNLNFKLTEGYKCTMNWLISYARCDLDKHMEAVTEFAILTGQDHILKNMLDRHNRADLSIYAARYLRYALEHKVVPALRMIIEHLMEHKNFSTGLANSALANSGVLHDTVNRGHDDILRLLLKIYPACSEMKHAVKVAVWKGHTKCLAILREDSKVQKICGDAMKYLV